MARTETVEFTNMCMICDGSRVVVIDRKKRDWPGITFPGGHIEPGESFTDAVIREVQEETGLHIRSPQLCGIKDWCENQCRLLCCFIRQLVLLFFYMKVPDAFAPISESFMEDNSKEHLVWASLDEDIKMYPEFFKTELKDPTDTVSGSSRARVLEPQAGHKIQCSLFEFMVHLALY